MLKNIKSLFIDDFYSIDVQLSLDFNEVIPEGFSVKNEGIGKIYLVTSDGVKLAFGNSRVYGSVFIYGNSRKNRKKIARMLQTAHKKLERKRSVTAILENSLQGDLNQLADDAVEKLL